MELIGEVRPYIIRAADLAVTLTPSPGDGLAWAAIENEIPHRLTAQHRTADEVKADALLIATELILARYPHLSTTVARLAAQRSYLDWRESL